MSWFGTSLVIPLLLSLTSVVRAQNPAVTIPDSSIARVTTALTEEFGAQGFTLQSTNTKRITFQRDQGKAFVRGQQFPMRLEVIVLVDRRADSLRLVTRRDLVATLSTGVEERRRMEPRQPTPGLQELLDRVRARYTDSVVSPNAAAGNVYAAALDDDSVAFYVRDRLLLVDTVVRRKDRSDGTMPWSWPELAPAPAASFVSAGIHHQLAFGHVDRSQPGSADSVFAIFARSDSSSFLLAFLGGGDWADAAVCRFREAARGAAPEFAGCAEP